MDVSATLTDELQPFRAHESEIKSHKKIYEMTKHQYGLHMNSLCKALNLLDVWLEKYKIKMQLDVKLLIPNQH